MVRTQVQLTEEQVDRLRRLATESGRSIAELVRLGVDLYLGSRYQPTQNERIERALALAGRFASGLKDVSAGHDRYLAEAYRT
jgi:Arc/MetJ-type ribon-helix-helix transcriptional regulator